MKTLSCRAGSLAAALGDAHKSAAGTLWSVEGAIALPRLGSEAGLTGRLSELAGRSVAILADQRATGAALVDLDGLARRLVLWPPDLALDHLPGVLREAEIDLIVTDRTDLAAYAEGTPIVRGGSAVERGDQTVDRPATTEWILFTSGTTGLPKMVVHTCAGLTGAIAAGTSGAAATWGTFYDIRRYGGLQILLRAIVGGASLILGGAGESTGDYLKRLAAHGVTHLSGTPSHWRNVLMTPAARMIAPAYVRLSGEIADQPILDALAAFYPHAQIGHAFASTEAGVAFEVGDGLAGFPAHFLRDAAGEVQMKVGDGTLRIRSSRTALRYLKSDLQLRDEDGFVDTSDMVEIRDGRVRFVGRAGGIINVGGLKVHPEEVETILNQHERVRMSLVKARRSPLTGAIVTADIVLDGQRAAEPLNERDSISEILAYCRARLPAHKVPASIRFVDSLEVLPSGKLARHG